MPSMTEFEIKQLDLLGQINEKLGKVLLPGHVEMPQGSGIPLKHRQL